MPYEYSDDSIYFLQLQLGGDRNFGYLLGDAISKEGAVVDPGSRPKKFVAAAERHGLKIKYILITHDHKDHMDSAEALAQLTGAVKFAGKDEIIEGTVGLSEGDRLPLGNHSISIFSTPGHTFGHVCYLFEDRLMTGDLLFCGKVGGTGNDFPGSYAKAEWESLQKIMRLSDSVMVFPGHDYYGGEGEMPYSTIGYERRHNPFLLCQDFNEFCLLKENWASYKTKHGIR